MKSEATTQKASCFNCKNYSTGIGAVMKNGTIYMWEQCEKQWGKPTPVGVLKNICTLHNQRKETK